MPDGGDRPGAAGAPPGGRAGAIWAVGLGVVVVVYVLRLDAVCGLYVDDAWYVLLAKALASGQGFMLANAPTPGILPCYPPGFPWLLSLVFRVAPSFPSNVWLLKSVSVAAMLGVAVLARRWCVRDLGLPRPLAVAIALATVLHPAFVFLATSTVMSECAFTCVELATVVLVERVARGRAGAATALVGGALGGFAFLIRSLAIGLVAAAGLYLAKERRWRAAAAFAVGAAVVAGPWLVHTRGRTPTPAEQAEVNDPIVVPYTEHFWMNVAEHPARGMTAPSELPARAWGQLQGIARRIAGALEVYPLYRTIEAGSWMPVTPATNALSFGSAALVLIGFLAAVRQRVGLAEILTPVALLIVALWPFSPFRFVLPLLPFVLAYTALGVRVLARLVTRRDGWGTALATVVLLAGVSLAAHATYVWQLRGPVETRPPWGRIFDEHLDVLAWVHDHVPADQIVAAINPALVTLYAGQRTVGYYRAEIALDEWRRLGVHYLADTSYIRPNLNLPEGRFRTVHRSPTMNLRVLDLQRLYESR